MIKQEAAVKDRTGYRCITGPGRATEGGGLQAERQVAGRNVHGDPLA